MLEKPTRNRRWWTFGLYVFFAALISAARAGSIFNYSLWNIDEEQVVMTALGFLGHDLNPHFFEYHTLPMYVLSLVYFGTYMGQAITGLVSSNIEFASQVFNDDSYFFVAARLLFSFVHTAGCFVLAHIIAKNYASKAAAFAFLGIVFLLPESVVAANYIRVDTFVFLFLALTIYYSCFAKKNRTSFLLAIMFCTAAFACKIPAIIFLPILFIQQAFLIYRGVYPKHYLIYLALVPPLALMVFMPYMFLDHEAFQQHLLKIFSRASGEFIHVGKIHHFDELVKLKEIFWLIAKQVGLLSILFSLALPLIAVLRKDKNLLVIFAYVAAYCGMFTTSATVDSYWFIPVYPLLVFMSVILIQLIAQAAYKLTFIGETKLETGEKSSKSTIPLFAIMIYAIVTIGFNPQGWHQYSGMLRNDTEDTRIVAGEWIKNHVPESSWIIIDGYIQHYLPRVLSKSPDHTLVNSGLNSLGAVSRNQFLLKAFDHHYARAMSEDRPLNAIVIDDQKFDVAAFSHFPAGTYVVISNAIYSRFYDKEKARFASELAQKATTYYDLIKSQRHIANFSGRGPTIDIYQFID